MARPQAGSCGVEHPPHGVVEASLHGEGLLLAHGTGGLEELAHYLAGDSGFQSKLVSIRAGFG